MFQVDSFEGTSWQFRKKIDSEQNVRCIAAVASSFGNTVWCGSRDGTIHVQMAEVLTGFLTCCDCSNSVMISDWRIGEESCWTTRVSLRLVGSHRCDIDDAGA